MTTLVPIHDQAGIEQLRRELRLDPIAVRRLRGDLLRRFLSDEAALAHFPAGDRVALHTLELFRRQDSAVDGASKLLLRTADGLLLESVILRPQTGRTTVCVSSQVGCAAACQFCASGQMGLARNLAAEEILDQVVLAGQMLANERQRLRNVVFMGMGEPFHNERQLWLALETLLAREFFDLSPRKVLISTVGIPDAMLRCAARFPQVNLALSLHSVRQEVRQRLMPLADKHPLDELREAIVELNAAGKRVMLEYLLLAKENDAPQDARELIAWTRGLNVHINLIPLNPIDDAPRLAGSDAATRTAFASQLKAAGLATTVRYSLGNDIAAACGQLARR
ncbi:MAG: 23S rRNA (adenine(2503)-C(2))-methyltransferase RlmN [Pirellulales bacterium]